MDDKHYFAEFAEDPPEDFGKTLYEKLQQLDELTHNREDTPSMNNHIHALPETILRTPSHKRIYGHGFMLAMVATIATALLIGVFVFNANTPQNHITAFQPDDIDLNALIPITFENADQVEHLMTLGNGGIHDIALSPDNQTLAVANQFGIFLHDINDLSAPKRQLPGQTMEVTQLVYHPDGTALVASVDNDLWFLHPQTGEVLSILETGYSGNLAQLAFSPDGGRIIAHGCLEVDSSIYLQCEQQAIRIWDVSTGELEDEFQYSTDAILVTHNNDFTYVVYQDKETYDIHLIDLSDAQTSITIPYEPHPRMMGYDYLRKFHFTADGEALLAIDATGTALVIWQIAELLSSDDASLVEPARLEIRGEFPNSFFFDPINDNLIISSSHGTIGYVNLSVFDWRTSEDRITFDEPLLSIDTGATTILSQIISSDHHYLISHVSNGQIQVWDYEAGEILGQVQDYGGSYGADLDIIDDTGIIVAVPYSRGHPHAWNLNTSPIEELPLMDYLGEDYQGVANIEINDDGTLFAYSLPYQFNSTSGNLRRHLSVYDVNTAETTLVSNDEFLSNGGMSPPYGFFENDTLVMGLSLHRVQRWNPISGWETTILQDDVPPSFNYGDNLTFSNDGGLLAVQSACIFMVNNVDAPCLNSNIALWDTVTGELLGYLENVIYDNHFSISTLEITSDNNFVVISQCVEIEQENYISRCLSHELRVWDISGLHSGAENDAQANTGDEIPEIEASYVIPIDYLLTLSRSQQSTIQLTNDANVWIASFIGAIPNGEQGILWRVDLESEIIEPLLTTDNRVSSITFNDNGTMLAVGGFGVVEIWGIQP